MLGDRLAFGTNSSGRPSGLGTAACRLANVPDGQGALLCRRPSADAPTRRASGREGVEGEGEDAAEAGPGMPSLGLASCVSRRPSAGRVSSPPADPEASLGIGIPGSGPGPVSCLLVPGPSRPSAPPAATYLLKQVPQPPPALHRARETRQRHGWPLSLEASSLAAQPALPRALRYRSLATAASPVSPWIRSSKTWTRATTAATCLGRRPAVTPSMPPPQLPCATRGDGHRGWARLESRPPRLAGG
ncbi:hypothetical protein CDD83_168 [Cordyceps sp. RAO-2017]|nr:hypothetical protein CDD83_168 [Cordyceps sp. RAO-2017]